MLICGMEFPFSALDADDVDRMNAAMQHMQEADAAEHRRYAAEKVPYTGVMRSQCGLIMNFLDEVLGEGAAERLGLTGSNLGAAKAVCASFKQAIAAEQEQFAPQPQDRAQSGAVAHETPWAPIVLPTAQNAPVPLAAPAESDVPAAVARALPQVMQFLRTPAGAKLLAETVAQYQSRADNG